MSDKSPEVNQNNQLEPNYWRSFNELYRDKNFIEASHAEFTEEAKEDFNPGSMNSFSRRKFLALLGASAALAGAGCGHRDKGEIVPYSKMPEEVLPGNPNYYASTCTACSAGCGILIKTREGRPIKVDGNPQHPVNKGKICAKGQANILNLYDPERIKSPLKKVQGGSFSPAAWQDTDYAIINELEKADGKEVAIITNKIISPATLKVINDFISKYPSTRVYSYEFFNNSSRNKAWKKYKGEDEFPLIQWDKAKIIVSLEADFLGTGEDKIETVRLFSQGRDVDNIDNFNRLYAVEGNMSVTGMNADYRIRLNPVFLEEFIGLISDQLVNGNNDKTVTEFAARHSVKAGEILSLVKDLSSNKGSSIIYAGDLLPAEIHTAVNTLNSFLGNDRLYRTDTKKIQLHNLTDKKTFEQLVGRMKNSGVSAVIHFDSNPVYHFPPELNYKEALLKVPMVITLTELESESSAVSDYVLPVNHNFESWGDAKIRSGFYSLQQPVISPLFSTRQKEAILLNGISGKSYKFNENMFHDYLFDYWKNNLSGTFQNDREFENFWWNALHDGIIYSGDIQVPGNLVQQTMEEYSGTDRAGKKKFTVMFKESYSLGDGRFSNNGWLQELPHPVSKVTWDNYAAVSYKTAKELSLDTNDLVEINIDGRSQILPVLVQPGAADNTFTIEAGYGRTRTGVIGSGVGFNINHMKSLKGGFSEWIYATDDVKKADGSYKLASSQEHHVFDDDLVKDQVQKRNIIREGTVQEYKKDRTFLKGDQGLEQSSVYGIQEYPGVKWGMAIDMNKCLGCGDCIVACTSENNVPVVGKDQVLVSREMQWLRVDRYYSGTPDEPNVLTQVMLCQHCDHAPCENVCPVAATTHSPDGLNQMVYNRCVGTRYCSNNCPYKVRRFNFFNFRDHFMDGYQENNIFGLLFNPEVTVRSRGVMEKCTFCIQRIMKAREDAVENNRPLKGTDVTTACQDACNSNAISFGDMNDKESHYSRMREHDLGYYVLEELNTRPNVTYIAKLRNKNQEEA